ncbi:MAG: hypothetical protein GXO32_08915 [Crenarchaeota archaeon]|nr:hypothetical protein [Thermoproteota archaeon]
MARRASMLELVTLFGFLICVASFITFGISDLCSINSVVRGMVRGFVSTGDLSSWGPANLMNLMAVTSFTLSLTALSTYVAFLKLRRLWLLATSGSIMLALVVFLMPLFKLVAYVMHSVARLCMERAALSVDYGVIYYAGPTSCSHSQASSLSLLAAFVSAIATACGVLIHWFESVVQRYSR